MVTLEAHSCFTILFPRGTHPKYVWHLAPATPPYSFTLDHYSHSSPSMCRHATVRGSHNDS
jgi:hypothetical protein